MGFGAAFFRLLVEPDDQVQADCESTILAALRSKRSVVQPAILTEVVSSSERISERMCSALVASTSPGDGQVQGLFRGMEFMVHGKKDGGRS